MTTPKKVPFPFIMYFRVKNKNSKSVSGGYTSFPGIGWKPKEIKYDLTLVSIIASIYLLLLLFSFDLFFDLNSKSIISFWRSRVVFEL